MASVTRLRRPSVVRSRHWRKQAKETIISGMGGCSWCRVGLGNPYSTRCVTALPHFRIVLSRPASSPHFGEGIDVIDSVPIAVCDHIRIRRSKIYSHEDFRGYQASKKRYFYGRKIHLMVTQDGQPVACFLTPGSFGDVDALTSYAYTLPDGAIIYADKAYNDYEIEDLLKEAEHIHLLPMRKKNSKRALSPSISFVQSYHRKRVETAGSLIAQLLPKSIHAVTSQGFELKVALFVIASSLNCYLNL